MKKMRRKLSALVLALALSLSLAAPALAAEKTEDSLADVSREAAAAAKTYGAATQINWAVWQEGEIIESGCDFEYREDPSLGHLASLVRGTTPPRRLYGIGSVSKMYTTVAVMQLAEEGKLKLDEPVVQYLPEFKMADERYQDITVRMLLNHSSGLMGSSLSSGLLFDDTSSIATDRLLERLAAQRLKADPGAYSVYCNDGFTLAELVVEAVSGMDFMDYLQASVLAPAGLEETYDTAGAGGQPVVETYQGEDPRILPMDCLGVLGTGGIYATAEDLASFGGALTGEALLEDASLAAMGAPEYARGLWPEEGPDTLAFGLGWDNVEWYPFAQSGIQALVKGGDTQYYHAALVVIPEYKLAAAVLSSGGASTYNEMAASRMLTAALGERDVEVDESPLALPAAEPAAMPGELTKLSGYYASLYTFKIDVAEDGTLTLHYMNMPQVPDQTFTYYSDGSFRDEDNAAAVRLVEEDNGQTYLYQRTFTELPGLGGLPGSNYAAMKLPENEISPELQAKWDKAMGGAVLPMNERYSSQVYLSVGALLAVEPDAAEGVPGYAGALRIEDGSHARCEVQIPGSAGRDGSDMELCEDGAGGLWYYQSNGAVYMDMEAVPPLSAGKDHTAVCTIQPDGYARWYRVDGKTAGKSLTVRLPEDAGFWAYDSEGTLAASSVLWGDSGVEQLPEGGLIVFAGEPGAQFTLAYSQGT